MISRPSCHVRLEKCTGKAIQRSRLLEGPAPPPRPICDSEAGPFTSLLSFTPRAWLHDRIDLSQRSSSFSRKFFRRAFPASVSRSMGINVGQSNRATWRLAKSENPLDAAKALSCRRIRFVRRQLALQEKRHAKSQDVDMIPIVSISLIKFT